MQNASIDYLPAMDISYVSTHNLLVARSNGPPTESYNCFALLPEHSQQHCCTRLLLDLRQYGVLSDADWQLVFSNLLPKLTNKATTQLPWMVALVGFPAQQPLIQSNLPSSYFQNRQDYQALLFLTEREALEWLAGT